MGDKLLPEQFILCSRDDLIVLIARMLNSLIALNDMHEDASSPDALLPASLTRFHSRTPPSISVYSYLARLARYSSLENAVLLSAVYYIDLLSTVYPAFTLNSLTVHRFLLTATTVGSKGLCDSFCTNEHYAKVGGIHANELDILEREFLAKVTYRILPREFNIEKCSEESRIVERYARKNSIATLEDSRNLEQELLGASTEDNNQHPELRPNAGYTILDMYYTRMVSLVGSATGNDDSQLAESVRYEISADAMPASQNAPKLIKADADTMPDERFRKLLMELSDKSVIKKNGPIAQVRLDSAGPTVVLSPLKRPMGDPQELRVGKRNASYSQ